MKIDFSRRQMRRELRSRQQQVEQFGAQAETFTERYFFRRLDKLSSVRRFVIGWTALFILLAACMVGQLRALDGYFQTLRPVPGGIYTEGIVGEFTNANPLFAVTPVDETISKLLFSGLLTYDQNNKLVGDLASSWSVDASGKIYTVKLRPHLLWQDGVALTAQDVVYTYSVIQNPDAHSPLNQSWLGVQVAAPDPETVTFTLPNLLSSFPYNMTNGIIPEHKLKGVAPVELRSVEFNTAKPVGSGPFVWQTIEVSGTTPEAHQQQIALSPNARYYRGQPKLASFVVHAFHSESQLTASFNRKELTAASFAQLPPGMQQDGTVDVHNFILTAATMVFFRAGSPVLTDTPVRRALVLGAQTDTVLSKLGYPTRPVRGPLLLGQLGYDKTVIQPAYNKTSAEAALDGAGWTRGPNGYRSKAGKPLSFKLYGLASTEATVVTIQLLSDWQAIGVNVELHLQTNDDLQRTIANHDYDALLYGIAIGPDPDVFVYWHSSQNDPRSNRLNLSEFNAKVADIALEAGRTRNDPALRVVKYKPFLQAWQQTAPALGLYQPRYIYSTHGTVFGLNDHILNSDIDRLNNVEQWQIRQIAATNH